MMLEELYKEEQENISRGLYADEEKIINYEYFLEYIVPITNNAPEKIEYINEINLFLPIEKEYGEVA